jgi:hypothetical protein
MDAFNIKLMWNSDLGVGLNRLDKPAPDKADVRIFFKRFPDGSLRHGAV